MAFLLIIKQFGHCLQCLPECNIELGILSLPPPLDCVCMRTRRSVISSLRQVRTVPPERKFLNISHVYRK